jgi:hypothetical protein
MDTQIAEKILCIEIKNTLIKLKSQLTGLNKFRCYIDACKLFQCAFTSFLKEKNSRY